MMNKKILVILFVTLLFMGGITNICADELPESTDNASYDLIEPLPFDPPSTLSGVGNGGGNPG